MNKLLLMALVLTIANFTFADDKGAMPSAPPAASEAPAAPVEKKAAKPAKAPKFKDVTKLQKEELKKGKGKVAKAGDFVTVHYTGWLTDGTEFDSSVKRGQPFTFNLGRGEVIKGWDEGVAGMKIGGKRRIHIPSDKGYGVNGSPPVIPPNASLHFDVELLDVKS